MKNCLVVVDMVNGFINEGALSDPKINRITPNIIKLMETAIKKGYAIIEFKDTHTEDDIEFTQFPPHCIKGTIECEIIPELKKYESRCVVIEKNTTNGFNTKKFQSIITRYKFDNIVVVGCCTDICVENFAVSLKKFFDNNNINTKVIVPKNAVETFDAPNHNAEICNNKAFERMANAGIYVIEKCNCEEKSR